MKKENTFENWGIEHPYEFWIMQDEYINKRDIKLYEGIWNDKKFQNKITRGLVKEGLELLYAERKEIAFRKAHLGSQAGGRVLRWSRKGIVEQVGSTGVISKNATDIQS